MAGAIRRRHKTARGTLLALSMGPRLMSPSFRQRRDVGCPRNAANTPGGNGIGELPPAFDSTREFLQSSPDSRWSRCCFSQSSTPRGTFSRLPRPLLVYRRQFPNPPPLSTALRIPPEDHLRLQAA